MDVVEKHLVEEFRGEKENYEQSSKYSDEEILMMNPPTPADYDLYIWSLEHGAIPFKSKALTEIEEKIADAKEELKASEESYEKLRPKNHQGASEAKSDITFYNKRVYRLEQERDIELAKIEVVKQTLIKELQEKSDLLKQKMQNGKDRK